MTMYVRYRGKMMKVVSRKGKRYYLKPIKAKSSTRFGKHFRTYRNLKRYGVSKQTLLKKNPNSRLKMRGRGGTPFDGKSQGNNYITQNDDKWISSLSNPYDKKIAKDSIKQLSALRRLYFIVEPDADDLSASDMIKLLTSLKGKIVQEALGGAGKRIGDVFKDIGLTLAGKGWLWESGQPGLESITERKAQLNAALDELIGQARVKAQNALQTLQQLYLKQGDREEQENIREEERERQDKIHEKDRRENLPDAQTVEELNPLGYVTRRRKSDKFDLNDPSAVAYLRQHPVVREVDPSYYKRRDIRRIDEQNARRQQLARQQQQQQQQTQQPRNVRFDTNASSWQ